MKIGVSTYSFEKYLKQTGCGYIKVCDIAKEMGFDGIEFTELNTEWMPEAENAVEGAKIIRKHCEEIGLPIISHTVGANFLSDDPEAEVKRVCEKVDIAEAFGAKVFRHDVCFSMPRKHLYNYREAIKTMAPYIRKVTEYAAAKGIRTCTENHGFIFQSPERVEELILAVGHENYGWLCDMGNFLCADEDVVKSVSIAAPYAFHAHVKDFIFKDGGSIAPVGFFKTRGGNYLRGTIVGHGVVPVVNCIDILKRAGYDNYLSIEFEGAEDNLYALEAGLEYLRRII